jgi:hypothetical protein
VQEAAPGELLGERAGDGAWTDLEPRSHPGLFEERQCALDISPLRWAGDERLIEEWIGDAGRHASTYMLGLEESSRPRVIPDGSHHFHPPADVLELGLLDLRDQTRVEMRRQHDTGSLTESGIGAHHIELAEIWHYE